jgi:hypothetical protein
MDAYHAFGKFPVNSREFPVNQKTFPVNSSRELYEKSLQRSDFWLKKIGQKT